MEWVKSLRKDEPHRCPICRRELELSLVPDVRGRQGEAEVFFEDLPTMYCGLAPHARHFVHPDFGARLIDAIFWKKFIPLGRPGVWAKVKCINCGKNLTKEPAALGEIGGVLEIKDASPFNIRIQGPVTTCPHCGTKQLKATKEVGTDVSTAVVDAFKKIKLEP